MTIDFQNIAPVILHEPVFHWINQRYRYVKENGDLEWVLRGPLVSCLLPALCI